MGLGFGASGFGIKVWFLLDLGFRASGLGFERLVFMLPSFREV